MADCEVKAKASQGVTPQGLVTDDNVRAALIADKGANVRLIKWKVVDFTKQGDNYACVVSSVEVVYELNGQRQEAVYVVKLNPCKSSPMAETLSDIAFVKEANFYLKLVPELDCMLEKIGQRALHFPKCFSADLRKEKEVIYLEDLRSRGYKMYDRKRGLDEAHTTLVVKELARLHAGSFLLHSKYPGEDLLEKYPYIDKDMHYLVATSEIFLSMIKDSLKFAQEILKKVEGYERAIVWIDGLIPNLVDIMYEQLKCGEPKVVRHGDCWNNNLLFKYDKAGHPEDVMLLDLQLVNYGSPIIDLTYLIYTSTTRDVRKPNLQSFLNCYYETFSDILEAANQEAPFTQEQLFKAFRDKTLYGAIFGMMSIPILLLESDGAVDSAKDTDEYIEEKIEHARSQAMETLDTNPLLKPRFLSLFDDLMEIGLIS